MSTISPVSPHTPPVAPSVAPPPVSGRDRDGDHDRNAPDADTGAATPAAASSGGKAVDVLA